MQQDHEPRLSLDERTRQAVPELEATISKHYPTASFAVTRSPDDPRSIHLEAVVDVDDPDEVGDLVIERLVELQAEDGIPIHVIPLRSPERIAAARSAQALQGVQRNRGVPTSHGFIPQPS